MGPECVLSLCSVVRIQRRFTQPFLNAIVVPRLQVTERLGRASSPAVRAKLQALLQAAVQGIAVNPTVTTEDLFIFVHGAMDAGLAAEEAARAAAAAAAEAAGQASADGAASFCLFSQAD